MSSTAHSRAMMGASTIAVTALTLLVGAGCLLPAASASATSAVTVTGVQAGTALPQTLVDRADTLLASTDTGFVHQEQGFEGYLWTAYSDGTTHTVPGLDGVSASQILQGYSQHESVAYTKSDPSGATQVVWVNVSTGATTVMTLPAVYTNPQVSDSFVLVREDTPNVSHQYHICRMIGTFLSDTPITLPAGATADDPPTIVAGAGRSFVIRYQLGLDHAFGLVDGLTGQVTPLDAASDATGFHMGVGTVVWFSNVGGPALHRMTIGQDVAPTVVPITLDSTSGDVQAFSIAGSLVWYQGPKGPLHYVPEGTSQVPSTLMSSMEQGLQTHSSLGGVAGIGTVGGVRAFYKTVTAQDGTLVMQKVRDLPPVEIPDPPTTTPPPAAKPVLLARDASGTLWRYQGTGNSSAPYAPRTRIGGGWQIYTALTSLSGQASDGTGDAVARDSSGVLWYYRGSHSTTVQFLPRTRVGAGWNIYNSVIGAGDLTGDGRPDLIARDASGVLWLYRGTGSTTAPFQARTRIGSGWNIYGLLVRTGDVTGDGRSDLIARDANGAMWLYRGTGNAAAPYATRSTITAGSNTYSAIVGVGDLTGDGRADLIARDTSGVLWLYPSTNNVASLFQTRIRVGAGWNIYNALM